MITFLLVVIVLLLVLRSGGMRKALEVVLALIGCAIALGIVGAIVLVLAGLRH